MNTPPCIMCPRCHKQKRRIRGRGDKKDFKETHRKLIKHLERRTPMKEVGNPSNTSPFYIPKSNAEPKEYHSLSSLFLHMIVDNDKDINVYSQRKNVYPNSLPGAKSEVIRVSDYIGYWVGVDAKYYTERVHKKNVKNKRTIHFPTDLQSVASTILIYVSANETGTEHTYIFIEGACDQAADKIFKVVLPEMITDYVSEGDVNMTGCSYSIAFSDTYYYNLHDYGMFYARRDAGADSSDIVDLVLGYEEYGSSPSHTKMKYTILYEKDDGEYE